MIGIGSPVWLFNVNRRVYRELNSEEKQSGKLYASGGPIWREHWEKHIIESETRLSWVIRNGTKIRKKNPGHYVCFSEGEITERAYVKEHAHRIADQVLMVKDYTLLHTIAGMVGYEAKK